jgi:thioredoxin-related protein
MKKVLVIVLLWVSCTMLLANEEEKSGFLTTQWCAQKGLFTDCPMETVFCGYEGCHKKMKEFNTNIQGKIVLMVHDEGQYYTTQFNKNIKIGEILEKAINKNEVTLMGEIKGNHIIVSEFEAPPPPKKSFFKGCL